MNAQKPGVRAVSPSVRNASAQPAIESFCARYDGIEHHKTTVREHGDSAVAHSIVRMHGENASGPFDNRLMMIHVWVKDGGAWRLAAHQTTRLTE